MKKSVTQTPERDRTYKLSESIGYIDTPLDKFTAITLLVVHILMEGMYIWLECPPMVIINVFSILTYVVTLILIKKNLEPIALWCMLLEIYLHVVLATFFLGMECGYLLWLFGTFSAIFLYFSNSILKRWQMISVGIFGIIIIITYLIMTSLSVNHMLPSQYMPPFETARFMYFSNVVLGFGSIVIYTSNYNFRTRILNSRFRRLAEHDYLTGIYNRQRMQRILYSEVEREKGLGKYQLSLAIMDVDFFKTINDTYGHLAGDAVLKEIGTIFEGIGQSGTLYARWGGEEFLLIAPENCSYEEFCDILENLRAEIERHTFDVAGQKIKVTISLGAARITDGMSVEKLIHLADSRLYQAKQTGRNKVVFD